LLLDFCESRLFSSLDDDKRFFLLSGKLSDIQEIDPIDSESEHKQLNIFSSIEFGMTLPLDFGFGVAFRAV
jgi:hypothetical protein